MAPYGKAVAVADARQAARRAHRVDHGPCLAVAHEIGMRARGSEAGIVGGGDHGTLLDQLAQSGHLLKDEDRK